MQLDLADEIVVVVGGGRGIGLAIATEFMQEGAVVALLDRDAVVLQAAAELAEQFSNRCVGWQADVTDTVGMQRVAAEIAGRWGGCQHLVFAAGLGSGKFGFPFWNLAPADWPRVVDVNLLGAVHTLHAFREQLCQRGAGSVLLISSVAGQIGSQTDPPYSAAKAGLINFGQCAAKDFAPFGIRVNTICPGMIRTELNRSVYEAWARQHPEAPQTYAEWAEAKIRQVVPLQRWQEPEDIAAMAVLLASRRGRNITGQTINIDGGFVMHW